LRTIAGGSDVIRKPLLLLFLFVILPGIHAQSKPSLPQELSAQCVATVPADWGEYGGASTYGVMFKDGSGTLRLVTHFPCGLANRPTVALEIRKQ
jgi:hypothetical protein